MRSTRAERAGRREHVVSISVLTAIIALGAFFRLFHADWKLYSYDETMTSLRVSGHTFAEFEAFVHDGHVHRIGELARFQTVSPDRGTRGVWDSLVSDDPQHPPVYFVLTRFVAMVAGDSVFARRAPAIVFGLLALIAAWWFAEELFRDRVTALCFAALVAVAPFHVAYAQQAREYSLWTLLTLVSSALLLRAVRKDRLALLVPYAVVVALGLWSFIPFALVVVAHAIFLALPYAGASRRVRVGAIVAMLTGAAAFLPWIGEVASRWGVVAADTTWTATRLSAPIFAAKWLFNTSAVFFDLAYVSVLFVPISVALLAVAAWCCVVFARRGSVRASIFLAVLGGVSAAAFLIPDLVLHHTASLQSRYLTPLWLAIEAATASGIVTCVRAARGRLRVTWMAAAGALFAAGIASCAVGAYARSWWIANNDRSLPAVAATLAGQTDPVLVYVDDDEELLELAAPGNLALSFDAHRELDDDALAAAAHPFVVARYTAVKASPIVRRLRALPLASVFPSGVDPVIAFLRRRAAADRHDVVASDIAVYRVAPRM